MLVLFAITPTQMEHKQRGDVQCTPLSWLVFYLFHFSFPSSPSTLVPVMFQVFSSPLLISPVFVLLSFPFFLLPSFLHSLHFSLISFHSYISSSYLFCILFLSPFLLSFRLVSSLNFPLFSLPFISPLPFLLSLVFSDLLFPILLYSL